MYLILPAITVIMHVIFLQGSSPEHRGSGVSMGGQSHGYPSAWQALKHQVPRRKADVQCEPCHLYKQVSDGITIHHFRSGGKPSRNSLPSASWGPFFSEMQPQACYFTLFCTVHFLPYWPRCLCSKIILTQGAHETGWASPACSINLSHVLKRFRTLPVKAQCN